MRRSTLRAAMTAAVMLMAGMGIGACAVVSGSTGEQPSSVDTAPFVECMRAHDLPDFPKGHGLQ